MPKSLTDYIFGACLLLALVFFLVLISFSVEDSHTNPARQAIEQENNVEQSRLLVEPLPKWQKVGEGLYRLDMYDEQRGGVSCYSVQQTSQNLSCVQMVLINTTLAELKSTPEWTKKVP